MNTKNPKVTPSQPKQNQLQFQPTPQNAAYPREYISTNASPPQSPYPNHTRQPPFLQHLFHPPHNQIPIPIVIPPSIGVVKQTQAIILRAISHVAPAWDVAVHGILVIGERRVGAWRGAWRGGRACCCWGVAGLVCRVVLRGGVRRGSVEVCVWWLRVAVLVV